MAETAAEKKAREAQEAAAGSAQPDAPQADPGTDTPSPDPVATEVVGSDATEAKVLVQEVPDDGKSEWMYMKHPNIEGRAAGPIQRQAFNDLWSHKGWVIAPKPAEEIPV